MGRVKEHLFDFLENGGYDLGWNVSNAPPLEAISHIQSNGLSPWDYHGMTEEEFIDKENK